MTEHTHSTSTPEPIPAQVRAEFQESADLFNDALRADALRHARQPDWPRVDEAGYLADLAALGV